MRDGGSEARTKLVEAAVVHQIVTIPKPGKNLPPVYRRDVAKILIVEDDNVIADAMARHLAAGGFDPIVVGRGELGLARLRFENPDVCVLDLMLPELDGWKLIETARAEGIGTPIVVVSARGTEHDRVHALEIGADDYLVKPFSMRELVARVGAAARRGVRPAEEKRGDAIEIEELRIDPREVQAFVDGTSAALTPTEFRLLYTLALDRGRVVTRDELLQKVWGRRETHRDRTVDVFVRRLRQKIDRPASVHSFIQTRFGVGYKLEPERKLADGLDRVTGLDRLTVPGRGRHVGLVPQHDLAVADPEEGSRLLTRSVAGVLRPALQLEDDEDVGCALAGDRQDLSAAWQLRVPANRVGVSREDELGVLHDAGAVREQASGGLIVVAVERGAPAACDLLRRLRLVTAAAGEDEERHDHSREENRRPGHAG